MNKQEKREAAGWAAVGKARAIAAGTELPATSIARARKKPGNHLAGWVFVAAMFLAVMVYGISQTFGGHHPAPTRRLTFSDVPDVLSGWPGARVTRQGNSIDIYFGAVVTRDACKAAVMDAAVDQPGTSATAWVPVRTPPSDSPWTDCSD